MCLKPIAIGMRVFALLLALGSFIAPASAADPFASNNGIYPAQKVCKGPAQESAANCACPAGKSCWTGPYRTLNFDYPAAHVDNGWTRAVPREPIAVATAAVYVAKLKEFVAPSMRDMIEKPGEWDPAKAGWYDMPWQAEGGDAESGREAILGAFSGQVILKDTSRGLTVNMQNHTVVYYDATAASLLKKVWANPFNPDRKGIVFPEGAMVIKAAAVSPTPAQWPILAGAAVWNVFRPPVAEVIKYKQNPKTVLRPVVTELRLLQFDVIVKDSVAAPQTGWVFATFIYDKDAPGRSPWDRLVPLGAQWGNDPQFARLPRGKDSGTLRETWINPAVPKYAYDTLGWGGRLSGPIDVAKRHNVLYTDGRLREVQRASSCLSCHGTAQYPFVANLYPSPNRGFPPEGNTFLMYPPGSEMWARWFQNRSGSEPQNKNVGAVALDYDMLLMLAILEFDGVAGGDRFLQKRLRVH